MTRTRRTVLILVVLAAGLTALGIRWATSDDRAARRAFESARQLWESRRPASYTFEYDYCSGMCASCPVRITVVGDRVTRVVGVNPRCSPPSSDDAPTIDDVFGDLEHDRSAEWAGRARVSYDRTWGFPAWVDVLCDPAASDCGVGYQVTNFRALDRG